MDTIDIDKISSSGADKKVIEVYRELKRFKDAPDRIEWLKRDKEAYDAAVKNEMWTDEEKAEMAKTGQVPVIVNKLNKGVQGRAAIVTANNPEIKILPTRETDPFVAELLKWGIDFVWAKNSGNDVVYDAVRRQNLGGIGFFSGYQDESKGIFGRVVFEDNDPSIWYWDADAQKRDFSDTHLIKAQLRTKEYIKARYDGIKDEDLEFEKAVDTEPGDKTDTLTGGDNYNHDTKPPAGNADDKNVKSVWEIEAWMLKVEKEDWAVFMRDGDDMPTVFKIDLKPGQKPADVVEEYAAENGPFLVSEHWPRTMANRYLRIIVGKKLIKQKDDEGAEVDELKNPYGTDSDGDPVIAGIPLMDDTIKGAYAYAPTFYALPINKSLNKREAQFIFAVSKSLNAPVVRDAGSKWIGQPDKPGSELIMGTNAATQPYRMPPGTVDLSGLAMRIEEDKANIDDQFDLPEIMRGKIPKNQDNMSGRLGIALQDTASMMQNPALRGLESTLIRLAKLILAIMLKVWPRYMWERLLPEADRETYYPEGEQAPQNMGGDQEIEEKAKLKSKWESAIDKIEKGGVNLIDLDIIITAGSSLPTNRMAKNAEAMEMFKVGLYDRKAALKHSNDPEAEEIADRMDKKEAQMMQAGAMK